MNNFTQTLTCIKKWQETPDTISLVFTSESKNEQFQFEPGQFITIEIIINNKSFYRTYSISSEPNLNYLQLTIKKISDGIVSSYLFDSFNVGDTVKATLPNGAFYLTDQAKDKLCLFAAGSGITPIYSMLSTLNNPCHFLGYTPEVILFYGVKNEEDIIFKDELLSLAKQYPNLTVQFFIENTENNSYRKGFISQEVIKEYQEQILNADCYICGPMPFINHIEKTCQLIGVKEQHIHKETFFVSTESVEREINIVDHINIYPIKSTHGFVQSQALITSQGIEFDRHFMLINQDGKMVTARDNVELYHIHTALTQTGLFISYKDMPDLIINYNEFELSPIATHVWRDKVTGYSTTQQASQWFSEILGQPIQLIYIGEDSDRIFSKIASNVNFVDGYPVSIVTTASLDELNKRCPIENEMSQFRLNIVVKNDIPFAEDSWKRIRIGKIEFEVLEPVQRCVLTTIDLNSGEKHANNEPLNTLSKFRADKNGGIDFGQNIKPLNSGIISAGDELEVLEYQEAAYYEDKMVSETINSDSGSKPTDKKSFTIKYNKLNFIGDNQSTILEQVEKAGGEMISSCRSGSCGCCKAKIITGKVHQPAMPGITEAEIKAGYFLPCSCVAQGDLEFS